MKKRYIFLMLLAIVTLLATCKKPEPEQPEPTYDVTFWANEDFGGAITVNLYNNSGFDKENFIIKDYSSTPECGADGCAVFKNIKPGKYYYSAICGYYEWYGEINVSETCTLIKLSDSNAIIKYNLTFWSNDSDDVMVNLYKSSGYDESAIISKILSSTPDCGDAGCATFENIEPGKYYYHAINADFEWEGEVNVSETCKLIKLNESNAIVKYNLTFWTNDNDCSDDITVNLYNNSGYDESEVISMVLSSTPDCGDTGCATFEDIEPGKYYYYAISADFEWEGEVNVSESCKLIKLDESNAIEKEKATVTFWTDDIDCQYIITVNLWKTGDPNAYDEYAEISMRYSISTPDCGDEGCANFYDVEYGNYTFTADDGIYEWGGNVVVSAECHRLKLYVGKAKIKEGVEQSDIDKLQPLLNSSIY